MLALPRVKPRDPAGHAILSALEGAVLRIQVSDPEARRGESEGIHRLRTSTRRLRSELRAFHDLVDPLWREQIQGELKWLAGVLGDVRDLDVLAARLRGATAVRDESDVQALAPLLDELEARHARALRALRDALQSDRYRNLQSALQRAIAHPALKDEAWEPCRTALPPVAAAAWRRLKKAARDLQPSDPDVEFHEVRKRAKRARYTAELIASALGHHAAKDARRFIRLTTQVQDALGEHQDAMVASRTIEEGLDAHPEDGAFAEVARRLLESQREVAQAGRTAFFKIWDRLDRKKVRRWMSPPSKAKCKSHS
jgi:CHAD domain-containing protein